jgi:hypothetical protein
MDPVALATTALGAGVTAGLALIGVTVAGVEAIRPAPGDYGAPLYLLAAGTLGGVVLSGVVTWWLLSPFPSTYRRGGLAMVSGFATVPLMLIYPPVHAALGTTALLAVAAIAAALSLMLARRARRLAAG